ncbi:porin, partial [Mycobacterium vulneris]
FKDNDINILAPDGKLLGSAAATRQNLMYQDLPVNAGGTIDLAASIITAQGGKDLGARHDGWQVSAFHKQKGVAGVVNNLGVQYGVGPGTGIG